MEIETDAFFGQLTFDPLYIVPFNSAQGFDLEVTDGAMRSKKGEQGVKRRQIGVFGDRIVQNYGRIGTFCIYIHSLIQNVVQSLIFLILYTLRFSGQ